MKNTSLTPAAFSTRKRILALLVAMLLLSSMLPVSAIGLDNPEKAEPAWTAEEIADTFHVSEENITQLQEDDNGHTLFVLDEYTFVCAPNGARTAAVTYTADYPIELIVSCTENGVMLGSALPYVENPSDGMIWDGTYEFLDYDTGEVTPVKDANAFYAARTVGFTDVNFTATINGKPIPHPSYDPLNSSSTVRWTDTAYNSPYGFGNGAKQCHGFGLFIFDYLFAGQGAKINYYSTDTSTAKSAEFFLRPRLRGTLVRANTSTGQHTLVLVGQNGTGIYVYHANWADNQSEYNMVKLQHITWAAFATKFLSIDYILTPQYCTHSVSRWVMFDSKWHRGTCSNCGDLIYRDHYAQVAGTNVTCKECGYVGSMGGMTRSTGRP